MKIMTLGNGFVANHLPYPKITERVFNDEKSINQLLDKYQPEVLVNCIGRTGSPNVDWCESNKTETYIANTIIPLMLAHQCEKKNIRLVHIGSGCIFFGTSPNLNLGGEDLGWNEENFANPKSYYSSTKYSCDLLLNNLPHVTILRIRMPFSSQNSSRNLITKLIGYQQVINEPNSMTFMEDLVRAVDWAIQKDLSGIYHVTNPGTFSAAQIMREYKKYVSEHSFKAIDEDQLDKLTLAKRSNCILDCRKILNTGFKMMPIKQALQICMFNYIQNSRGTMNDE